MDKDTCLLQVAVGEVPRRVVNQDDALLDLRRKGGPPESGRVSRSNKDAQLGSIY